MSVSSSRFTETNDGVWLHYLEAGHGPDLLLVPGWSLTAELWRHQIEEFSRTHHVIAMDPRGHGLSDKPAHGFRLARFAMDVHNLIENLGLVDVSWVSHSMGCAVGWTYWELFGGRRLNSMVLIDQPAVTVALPHWPDGLAEKLGVRLRPEDWAAFTSRIRGSEAESVRAEVIGTLHTSGLSEQDQKRVLQQSMLLPPELGGAVGFDHGMQDFRSVLANIDVPALVIGGEASFVPVAAMESVANGLPNAELRILSEAERGSHMAFLENPALVNREIRSFLTGLR